MNREILSPELAPTAANYAHAVLSEGPRSILHTSGIVPIGADGTVADSLEDQAKTVWTNVLSILRAADMAITDVVSVTTYVVHGELLAPVMAARDLALGGHRAASTLVTVPALARPQWRLEIAIVAIR